MFKQIVRGLDREVLAAVEWLSSEVNVFTALMSYEDVLDIRYEFHQLDFQAPRLLCLAVVIYGER